MNKSDQRVRGRGVEENKAGNEIIKLVNKILEEDIRIEKNDFKGFSRKMDYLLSIYNYEEINKELKLNIPTNYFLENMLYYLAIVDEKKFMRLFKYTEFFDLLNEELKKKENIEVIESNKEVIARVISKFAIIKMKRPGKKENRVWNRRRNAFIKSAKRFMRYYSKELEEETIIEIINNYKKYDEKRNFSAYVAINYLKEKMRKHEKEGGEILKMFSELNEIRGLLWFDAVKLITEALLYCKDEEIEKFREKWSKSIYDRDRDFARFLRVFYLNRLKPEPSFKGDHDEIFYEIQKEIEANGHIKSTAIWYDISEIIIKSIKNNGVNEEALKAWIISYGPNIKDRDNELISIASVLYYYTKVKNGDLESYEKLINELSKSYDFRDSLTRRELEKVVKNVLSELAEYSYKLINIKKETFERFLENWEKEGNEEDRILLKDHEKTIKVILEELNKRR